jgi:hypothetical protein
LLIEHDESCYNDLRRMRLSTWKRLESDQGDVLAIIPRGKLWCTL